MPRNKPLKTNRIRAPQIDIENAVFKVLKENVSLRLAAKMYKISKSKLARHIKDVKRNGEPNGEIVIPPRKIPNQVFTSQQETDLEDFLIKSSMLLPRLTGTDIRKLTYEFGKQLGVSLPSKWEAEKEAGKEWLYGFMKRHNKLSIRTPEGTGVANLNRNELQTSNSDSTSDLPNSTDYSQLINLSILQKHVGSKNSKMPRNKSLKTSRVRASQADIEKAVNKVLKEKISLQVAADMYNISKSKLARHIKDVKKNGQQDGVIVIPPRKIPNQVFTIQQEIDLEAYLIHASEILLGLTNTDMRKLVYEFGKDLCLTLPSKWEAEKEAGKDWLYNFIKRHKELKKIQPPEAISSDSFNEKPHQSISSHIPAELPTPDFIPLNLSSTDSILLNTEVLKTD